MFVLFDVELVGVGIEEVEAALDVFEADAALVIGVVFFVGFAVFDVEFELVGFGLEIDGNEAFFDAVAKSVLEAIFEEGDKEEGRDVVVVAVGEVVEFYLGFVAVADFFEGEVVFYVAEFAI